MNTDQIRARSDGLVRVMLLRAGPAAAKASARQAGKPQRHEKLRTEIYKRPIILTKLNQIKPSKGRKNSWPQVDDRQPWADQWGFFGFPFGRALIGLIARKAVEGYRTPGRWRVGGGSIPIGARLQFEISDLRKGQ